MPASSPFKPAISRDVDCLIFDRSVQNLTAMLSLSDRLPAHWDIGTALALLGNASRATEVRRSRFTNNRKGTHNGKSLL